MGERKEENRKGKKEGAKERGMKGVREAAGARQEKGKKRVLGHYLPSENEPLLKEEGRSHTKQLKR